MNKITKTTVSKSFNGMKKIFLITSLIFIVTMVPVYFAHAQQVSPAPGDDLDDLLDPNAPIPTVKTDKQQPVNITGQQPVNKIPQQPVSTKQIEASFDNPLKGVDSLADLFYEIVEFIIGLSYVVIAVFYLLAGFKFVKAQGNPEELSGAKRAFMNTTIGAIIIIGINVITQVIQSIIEGLQS